MTIDSALIDNLKTRFKYIYLLYDNDATGKKYSKKLCEQYRLMPIFVPEPVKDISDYRKTYGIVKTLGLLKSLLDEDREREEVPESY
jgi:5S rRNA maturation endonuclease (ribonuclease M5)